MKKSCLHVNIFSRQNKHRMLIFRTIKIVGFASMTNKEGAQRSNTANLTELLLDEYSKRYSHFGYHFYMSSATMPITIKRNFVLLGSAEKFYIGSALILLFSFSHS